MGEWRDGSLFFFVFVLILTAGGDRGRATGEWPAAAGCSTHVSVEGGSRRASVFVCQHVWRLGVKKTNELSDRGVTWLECKSERLELAVFQSPTPPPSLTPPTTHTQIVYRRDWKEAVGGMLRADVAWLCLPCAIADVSQAVFWVCFFFLLARPHA